MLTFIAARYLNDKFSLQQSPKNEGKLFVLKKTGRQNSGVDGKKEVLWEAGAPSQGSSDLVKTIRQMLKSSTPEQEIIENLKSLGLDEKSAKKMVLVAQSDALHVFRDEIEGISRKNVAEQLSKIQKEMVVPSSLTLEEKLEALENRLAKRLERTVQETQKPRKKIVSSLLELSEKLEEIKVPELKKRHSEFDESEL